MDGRFYVYMWLRVDGSPYYVGKGHGKRAFDKARPFRPRNADQVQIVKDDLTESAAFELEKRLIAEYGRKDLGTGILHNRTDGGEGSGGHTLNDEQRRVRSEISKNQSPEVCARIAATMKQRVLAGLHFSPNHKRKIKLGSQARSAREAYRANMSKAKKQGMTLEIRDKIRQGLKGKPKSAAHRANLKKAWERRRKANNET